MRIQKRNQNQRHSFATNIQVSKYIGHLTGMDLSSGRWRQKGTNFFPEWCKHCTLTPHFRRNFPTRNLPILSLSSQWMHNCRRLEEEKDKTKKILPNKGILKCFPGKQVQWKESNIWFARCLIFLQVRATVKVTFWYKLLMHKTVSYQFLKMAITAYSGFHQMKVLQEKQTACNLEIHQAVFIPRDLIISFQNT